MYVSVLGTLLTTAFLIARQIPPAAAQGIAINAVVMDTGIFSPLPLPPGNAIRSANGAPGPQYWQQQVDYTITAVLDTATKRLAGHVTIRYTNNSPDTLRFLWLQLDQNFYRPGSIGSTLLPANSRFGGGGEPGGIEIDTASVDGQAVTPLVLGAMMRVDLPRPLFPRGGQLSLALAYRFPVIEHGGDRMGRNGSLYQIAQWYPRLVVYDDVRGWNTDPDLTSSEFYLEYADIDYAVTLPAGYIIAGTGVLQNPDEVLTTTQRTRLAQARKSDTIIHVVTAAELASTTAESTHPGTRTWRFRAKRVRDDVAWAAAPDYCWDATSWDGILVQAFYRPTALAGWKAAAQQARFALRHYSSRWGHYPYPQLSVVEGAVKGMEYPMLLMVGGFRDTATVWKVLHHEVGHSWYPIVVGNNAVQYPWMAQGFDTFINIFADAAYWQRDPTPPKVDFSTGQSIMTPANRAANLGNTAYAKPASALFLLRDKVLGPEVFDAAFREYTRRWAFKHPQPADFFRTMEQVSGRDLAWFWRSWFYTTATLDQAVESVTANTTGTATIVLRNLGTAVMPVELELTHADSTKRRVWLPIEIWYRGDRFKYQLQNRSPVVAARVNPDNKLPDVLPTNDLWQAER